MKSDKSFNYIEALENHHFRDEKFLISQIESLLKDENSEGILIALKGDWGSGKTSTLKMLDNYFKNFHESHSVFFEAWKYHNETNPLLPLLSLISQNFPKSEVLKDFATKSFFKYAPKVGEMLLNSAFNFIGINEQGKKDIKESYKDIKREVQSLLNIAGEVSHIEFSEFDKKFNELKSNTKELVDTEVKVNETHQAKWSQFIGDKEKIKKQLFIFVDDLDRLMPKDAIELFEAIRFYLKIPRVVVIMGLNDKILTSHIEKFYKIEADSQREEFIEKLFDFSYELKNRKFDIDYMQKFHFDDIEERFREKIVDLFYELELDSITHRKWKRIANRIESEAIRGNFNMDKAKIACFKELFPESERFMRSFSEELDNLALGREIKPHLNEKLREKIKIDNAFFYFPIENFDKIFTKEDRIDEEII